MVGSEGFEPSSPAYQADALNHCATTRGWPGGIRTHNRVCIRHLRSPLRHRPGLVPSAGLEPARYSISSCSLCQLGYEGLCDWSALVGREGFAPAQQCGAFTERWAHSCPGRPTGAAEGTRTPISSLKRRVLLPLSYSGAMRGQDKLFADRSSLGLVPAGRFERPTFRMSRGCSAVELRWDGALGHGLEPR
jgi:hypothetical protein